MTTPVKVINLGLAAFASAPISSIEPPRTSNERYFAENYAAWRDAEMAARRWLFALHEAKLSKASEDTELLKPNAFVLPNDCLRPLREDFNGVPVEWERRGNLLYSANSELRLLYIRRVPEAEWEPLFVNVMAASLAVNSVEFVTQSATKLSAMIEKYKNALREALKANAFMGTSANMNDESWAGYTFIEARTQLVL